MRCWAFLCSWSVLLQMEAVRQCSDVTKFWGKSSLFFSVNHSARWWLNWGPVGGVLGASSSFLASTFLPPTLPLEVSPSTPLSPHFFLLSSQCIKCIILSHLALPSRTAPGAHTHTHSQCTCTASLRKWDKELATPKGPASVTPLPRWDHMALGCREERENGERRSGNRVGGVKKSAQD